MWGSKEAIVVLKGGLGNQMFQYALGRALSLRFGIKVSYDKHWYQKGPSERPFALNAFGCPINFARTGIRRRLARILWPQLERRHPALFKPLFFKSQHDGFKEAQDGDFFLKPIQDNLHLDGYWQSEQYFSDFEDVVRKDFVFVQPLDAANRQMVSEMAFQRAKGLATVSVHVRRGDYVSDPVTAAVHGIPSHEYYESAMAFLEKQCGSSSYYVFSDDLAWCRDHWRSKKKITYVDINVGRQDWMDMRLMSMCQHHIIANSSFSWWGAWLNPSKEKIVVAPKKWFLDASISCGDIIPGGWIRV